MIIIQYYIIITALAELNKLEQTINDAMFKRLALSNFLAAVNK